MNNITVIGLDNKTQKVEFSDGDNLMELLRDAGYDEIIAMCGGCCSCATCHVHITDQEKFSLNPREEDEQNLVEMADTLMPDIVNRGSIWHGDPNCRS